MGVSKRLMSYAFKIKSFTLPLVLLSKREKVLLGVAVFINLFLAFLDLAGVLLIGVMGSLAIKGLSSLEPGERVSSILLFLRIQDQNFEIQVLFIGIVVVSAFITKTILSIFILRKTLFFMARRAASMSFELVSKYFNLSVSQINERSTQNSIYSLTTGVTATMVGVIGASISLISDVLLLIVMGLGIFVIDPMTALLSVSIFGALSTLIYRKLRKKMKELGTQQNIFQIKSSQRIYEAIVSFREIFVRNRQSYYSSEIGAMRLKLSEGNAEIVFLTGISKYLLEVSLVITALLLAAYQFTTTTAYLAFANIAVFLAASTRTIPAILRLQQGMLNIRSSFAEAQPTFSLVKELQDVQSTQNLVTPFTRIHSGFSPHVDASGISFKYEESEEVIMNVSLYARPGEFVAIVGESGAGKSTLVDILLGALRPTDGIVTIAGFKPEDAYTKWPGAVSYVPQNCTVIDGSIRDNLALGYKTSEIPDEYFWDCLKKAHLYEFVNSLPKRLESYVGDRGTKLSGGQKQRLGIARALITQPRLLILDEATSSLDGLMEYEISESLLSLKGEVTLITIAHRLSTVVRADRIYYLENGSVLGVGSFDELKGSNSKFREQAEMMGL